MLQQYLTIEFLFEINRIQIQQADKFFLLVGVIAVVFAVIFKLSAKLSPSPIDAKYRNKFYALFLFLSLSEIFWFGARVQLVKFFGTHFIAILVILVAFVWFAAVVWKMVRNYRKEKTEWEKEQVKLKYLPK